MISLFSLHDAIAMISCISQDAGLTVMTNAALRTEPRSKDGCAKKAVRKRSAESESKPNVLSI